MVVRGSQREKKLKDILTFHHGGGSVVNFASRVSQVGECVQMELSGANSSFGKV